MLLSSHRTGGDQHHADKPDVVPDHQPPVLFKIASLGHVAVADVGIQARPDAHPEEIAGGQSAGSVQMGILADPGVVAEPHVVLGADADLVVNLAVIAQRELAVAEDPDTGADVGVVAHREFAQTGEVRVGGDGHAGADVKIGNGESGEVVHGRGASTRVLREV
jgi:hypothetical protein